MFAAVLGALRAWLGRARAPASRAARGPIGRAFDAGARPVRRPDAASRARAGSTARADAARLARLDPRRTSCHPRMVPDYGDPLFSAWRIARLAHQLVTDPRHLFDGNIFYPLPLTLTYSDCDVPAGTARRAVRPRRRRSAHRGERADDARVPAVRPGVLLRRLAPDRRSRRRRSSPGCSARGIRFTREHYSHLELQWVMFAPLAVVAGLADAGGPARRHRPALRRRGRRAVAGVDVSRRDADLVPRAVPRGDRAGLAGPPVTGQLVVACAAARGDRRCRRSPAWPPISEGRATSAANAAIQEVSRRQRHAGSDYGHAHIRLVSYQWQGGRGHGRTRAVPRHVDDRRWRPPAWFRR